MTKNERIARRVARALAGINSMAGWPINELASTKQLSVLNRAKRILDCGYVRPGDPHGWGGGHALATIYMEQRGGRDDCVMPLDYYSDTGFEDCFEASKQLGLTIEFVNAAVACVYE
jgi:hypothetical protein